MDGGSADIAGANTCPYILYIKKPSEEGLIFNNLLAY